jgi:hypothetical protein
VKGGSGDDTVTGTSAADTIQGGGGADKISANGGANSVVGGAGVDNITTNTTTAAGDTVQGGAGADQLDADAGKMTITDFALGGEVDLVDIAVGGSVVATVLQDWTGVGDVDAIDNQTADTATSPLTATFNLANGKDFNGSANTAGNTGIKVAATGNVLGSIIAGTTLRDSIEGGTGADTLSGTAGTGDTLTGGSGTDTFNIAAVATVTGAMEFTDLAVGEQINVDWTAGGTFADLHLGSGAARTDAGSSGVVSTVVDTDVASITAGNTDNIILFGNIANGGDGIAAALAGGSNATNIIQGATGDFSNGDELFVVAGNSTTSKIEIGIITFVGGDGFLGGDETFEHVATVSSGLTSAQVAALIDFTSTT